MGKDLSAAGEDILPAFPSSCGRSPRPDLAGATSEPAGQPDNTARPDPGRQGPLPGTAGCTHSCAELGAGMCQVPSSLHPSPEVLGQPPLPLGLTTTPCFLHLPLCCPRAASPLIGALSRHTRAVSWILSHI